MVETRPGGMRGESGSLQLLKVSPVLRHKEPFSRWEATSLAWLLLCLAGDSARGQMVILSGKEKEEIEVCLFFQNRG